MSATDPLPNGLEFKASILSSGRRGSITTYFTIDLLGKRIYADTVRLEDANARRRFAEEVRDCLAKQEPPVMVSLDALETKLLSYNAPDQLTGQPVVQADQAVAYSVVGGALAVTFTYDHPIYGRVSLPPQALCNFVARICQEITRDDGHDRSVEFALEGSLDNGTLLPRITVAAERFGALGWLASQWGSAPSIVVGNRTREHLRAAIQSLSSGTTERVSVFAHLGWRSLTDGRLVYLHANGAVGGIGVVTDLSRDGMQRYGLPRDLGDAERVRQAMRASLAFLDLGQPTLTYPLWSLVWRAAVCQWLPETTLYHLWGPSGGFKSTLAAALLAHCGDFATKDSLPAAWAHTDASLERSTFLAKDALLVVDDLNPESARVRREALDQRFAMLANNVGNRAARRRSNPSLTTTREFVPRGVVLSTGEYVPSIAPSRLLRVLPIPLAETPIDVQRLTAFQATLPQLPHAYAAFLDHQRARVLEDENAETERLKRLFEDGRERAAGSLYRTPRVAESVAYAYVGLSLGLAYANRIGVLSDAETKRHQRIGWEAILSIAVAHAEAVEQERASQRFLDAIAEALASGRAFLVERRTGAPLDAAARHDGVKLGWRDSEGIYLLPDVSFAVARDLLDERGGLPITPRALHVELRNRGLLRVHPGDAHLATRVRCEGELQRVIWLRPGALPQDEE